MFKNILRIQVKEAFPVHVKGRPRLLGFDDAYEGQHVRSPMLHRIAALAPRPIGTRSETRRLGARGGERERERERGRERGRERERERENKEQDRGTSFTE